ncbi:hypothetical protein M2202_010235 [Bradyrhizobium japonicum]|jgi:hypothetical protein|nr:hypothetical protein [Bradyrhizobium japonicum]MCP1794479.1 hypothetical protein [Bradyrhizobium japonicum]MCP1811254.1 hypothetical protein [Bradyrhizobium japonicum]MCP1821381.1 hypothetical protein [Bradyrhizobium japonicum]MCP1876416.1 hypothetical protein [Bradyrhizobium japonicum]
MGPKSFALASLGAPGKTWRRGADSEGGQIWLRNSIAHLANRHSPKTPTIRKTIPQNRSSHLGQRYIGFHRLMLDSSDNALN